MTIGSNLYQRQIASREIKDKRDELMLKVWSPTPWMVDAFTGSCSGGRYAEIILWCDRKFGPQAWPIHGKSGDWHMGGATVYGYTWIGFKNESMMNEFLAEWGEAKEI